MLPLNLALMVSLCSHPLILQCHASLLLYVELNKTGKPSVIPSLDLPDSQQAAPSVKSARGRAAKRNSAN